jgi:hypothetical protein
VLEIRAGNFVSEIEQHLGNAAHADSTDAYKMNALNLREHEEMIVKDKHQD